MPIPWTEELSVHVKEIDVQHQTFIGLLNETYQALYETKLKEELPGLLKQLVTYADFHFATEEKYFDLFKYEFSDEHKQIHQQLKKDAAVFVERFEKEGESIISDLLDFLKNWLVIHLENQDKKYTKCFNEHGLV